MSRLSLPMHSVIDVNGDPVSGAKLYSYAIGTSNPLPTYTTSALTIANTNPVVADSAGRFDDIFRTDAGYKFVLTDANDVTIVTWDDDGNEGGSGSGTVPDPGEGVETNFYEIGIVEGDVSEATNNWTTLNNYLADGATFRIPPGNWYFSKWDIPQSGVFFIGSSERATKVIFTTTADHAFTNRGDNGSGDFKNAVVVQDLTLTYAGAGQAAGKHGLYAVAPLSLKQVSLKSFTNDNLHLDDVSVSEACAQSTFYDVTSIDAGNNGLTITSTGTSNPRFNYFYGCRFSQNLNNGVKIDAGHSYSFFGGVIGNNTDEGMVIDSASSIKVDGVGIHNNGGTYDLNIGSSGSVDNSSFVVPYTTNQLASDINVGTSSGTVVEHLGADAGDTNTLGGGSGGGGGVFYGALIKKTTGQTPASAVEEIQEFQAEVYDTSGFADLGSYPTRLTVPDLHGISKVKVGAYFGRDTSSSDQLIGTILKNGSPFDGTATTHTSSLDSDHVTMWSAVVDVVAGDYFEITGGGNTASMDNAWLSIEAVEFDPPVPAPDNVYIFSNGTDASASFTDNISAAGTTQGAATALTTDWNRVTTITAASAEAVKLPAATTGDVVTVLNAHATATLKLFPNTGEQINDEAVNTSIDVPPGQHIVLTSPDGTNWYGEAEGKRYLRATNKQHLTPAVNEVLAWENETSVGGLTFAGGSTIEIPVGKWEITFDSTYIGFTASGGRTEFELQESGVGLLATAHGMPARSVSGAFSGSYTPVYVWAGEVATPFTLDVKITNAVSVDTIGPRQCTIVIREL